MKTFEQLQHEFYTEKRAFLNSEDFDGIEFFREWLDQRYAPAALPGSAQPGVSADASAATDNAAIAPSVPTADNGGGVSFRPTKDQMELLIWAVDEAQTSIGGKDPDDMDFHEHNVRELRGILAALELTRQGTPARLARSVVKAGLKTLIDSYL